MFAIGVPEIIFIVVIVSGAVIVIRAVRKR